MYGFYFHNNSSLLLPHYVYMIKQHTLPWQVKILYLYCFLLVIIKFLLNYHYKGIVKDEGWTQSDIYNSDTLLHHWTFGSDLPYQVSDRYIVCGMRHVESLVVGTSWRYQYGILLPSAFFARHPNDYTFLIKRQVFT